MNLARSLCALAALIAVAPLALVLSDGGGFVAEAQSPQPRPAQSAPAPSAPAGPVKTETTNFEGWVLTCQEGPPAAGAKTGKKACWGLLRVTDAQSKRVVVVWKIGRDGKDVPTIAITTPTGVLVRDGVDLMLGQNSRKLAYQWCNANECEASLAYDQALANELSAAKEATIAFRLQDGRQLNVKVAVSGADKVLAGLRKP